MRRLLIVDDDPEIREMLRTFFNYYGLEVETSPNVMAGMRAIIKCAPDLILLDVMMPNWSGYDALRLYKKKTSVPIVMQTSQNSRQHVLRALQLGAAGFIIKPYELDFLLETVLQHLGVKRKPNGAAPELGGTADDESIKLEYDFSTHRVIKQVICQLKELFFLTRFTRITHEFQQWLEDKPQIIEVLLARAGNGRSAPVVELPQALALLDAQEVGSLCFVLGLIQQMPDPPVPSVLDRQAVWQTGLATALVSREIAKQVGTNESQAFQLGFLTVLGTILLSEFAAESFEQALTLAWKESISLNRAIRGLMETDPCQLLCSLLDWEMMPGGDAWLSVLGSLEAPEKMLLLSSDEYRQLSAVVWLARWSVRAASGREDSDPILDYPPPPILQALGKSVKLDHTLLSRVELRLIQMKPVLGEIRGSSYAPDAAVYFLELEPVEQSPLPLLIRRANQQPIPLDSLDELKDLPEKSRVVLHAPSSHMLAAAAQGKPWPVKDLDLDWILVFPGGHYPDKQVLAGCGFEEGMYRTVARPFELLQFTGMLGTQSAPQA